MMNDVLHSKRGDVLPKFYVYAAKLSSCWSTLCGFCFIKDRGHYRGKGFEHVEIWEKLRLFLYIWPNTVFFYSQ